MYDFAFLGLWLSLSHTAVGPARFTRLRLSSPLSLSSSHLRPGKSKMLVRCMRACFAEPVSQGKAKKKESDGVE